MRILMPCSAFPPSNDGGGPISALHIANMLKSEGHEIRIIHISGEDKYEIYEGIPVKRKPSLNIYWNYYEPRPKLQKMIWHLLENGNPRAFFSMRKEMQEFQPDLVHTVSIENINVATWAAAKSLGIPVAHTMQNAYLLSWKGVMEKAGKPLDRQTFSDRLTSIGKRYFSRFVDLALGESNDMIQRHLNAGYFKNAVPKRILGALPGEIADSARPYPGDRPFRVGFIGVHTAFKGIDVLGRAASALPEGMQIEFLIAGTGRDSFAEEVHKLFPKDRTKFLGWTSPEDFFPQIDLLAVPSIGPEAFGRVVIEAFAHAVPAIGTNLGGLAESIKPDFNGLLFPPSDSTAIAECIAKIASDPDYYQTLSDGAVKTAPKYAADKIAATYTDTFTSLIERKSA